MTHETGSTLNSMYGSTYHCKLKDVILSTFLYQEENHPEFRRKLTIAKNPRDRNDRLLLLLLLENTHVLTHDTLVTCSICVSPAIDSANATAIGNLQAPERGGAATKWRMACSRHGGKNEVKLGQGLSRL